MIISRELIIKKHTRYNNLIEITIEEGFISIR